MKSLHLPSALAFLLSAGTVFATGHAAPALPADNQDLYVIEREIPGAGQFSAEKLKAISQTSCRVLEEMGQARIQWLHSYVTADKIYCVYLATSEETVREHARKGGFPANSVNRVANVISPKTAG